MGYGMIWMWALLGIFQNGEGVGLFPYLRTGWFLAVWKWHFPYSIVAILWCKFGIFGRNHIIYASISVIHWWNPGFWCRNTHRKASESSHFSTQQGLKTITATRRRSSIFSKSPRMVGQTEIPCCTRTGLGPWFKHGVAMEPQQVSDPFRNSFTWVSKNGVYP